MTTTTTTTTPTAEQHQTSVSPAPNGSWKWSCSCGDGSRPVLPKHAAESLAGLHDRSVAAPRIPDQPDGLDEHYEDDADLPDPHRAATRVRDWIAAWGDGLIDSTDGNPLYARDLEALCRAVLATTPADTTPGRPHRDEPPLDRDVVDVHLPAYDIA